MKPSFGCLNRMVSAGSHTNFTVNADVGVNMGFLTMKTDSSSGAFANTIPTANTQTLLHIGVVQCHCNHCQQ